MNPLLKSLLLGAVCLQLAYRPASAQGIIIGSPLGGPREGNSDPFDIGNITMRYQQVYGASDFAERIPQGGFITAIRFDIFDTVFDSTLPNLQINLSTTSKAVDGLSSVFAENLGLNNTRVFGPTSIHLIGNQTGFVIKFALSTPFFYDPGAGNLLLDVRNRGGGLTSPFSAANNSADTTSRVVALDVNSTSATYVDTGGLRTVFEVTPVPEPATSWLVGLGVVACCAVHWHKARRRHVAH